MTTPPRLVLASGSPRRRELLRRIGIEPRIRPVPVDETRRLGESPEDLVLRLARAKATAGARAGEIVLAADTVVAIDDEVLGKPPDAAAAAAMLGRLSGREHEVFTGVAVHTVTTGTTRTTLARTRVWFATLTEADIAWYVGTGEPLDKAGGYGIQGGAEAFVTRIDGTVSTVMGLPLAATVDLLREAGLAVPASPSGPARGAEPD